MIAGTLEIQMLANLARLADDMGKARSTVERSMQGIEGAVASAKRALGALGISLGVGYFVRMVKGAIDAQDELVKLSQKLNISVEGLVGLRHAASLSGLQFEGLQKAIKSVSSQMLDASFGLSESQRNFAALGIDVKDTSGNLKSAEAVIIEVADVFAKMGPSTERTALAVKLFGKAGLDMIPMLDMGSVALAKMVSEGQALNPVTEESARQAELLNDSMEVLTKSFTRYGTTILNQVLPVSSELMKMFAEERLLGAIKQTATETDRLDKSFQILPETMKVITILGGNVSFVLQGIGREIGGITAQLAALGRGDIAGFKAIREALIEDGKQARKELDEWEKRVMELGTNVAASIRGGGTGGITPADEAAAKAREKLLDAQAQAHAQRLVEAIERQRGFGAEIMLTEEELTANSQAEWEKRFDALREYHNGERALARESAQYEFDLLKQRVEGELAANQAIQSMQRNTWGAAAELLQQFAGKSRLAAIAVVAINKALAIAQVIQSTAVAVMRAFADLGPIAGAPVAAKMKLLGGIQIGLIAATGIAQAVGAWEAGGAGVGTPANPVYTASSGSGAGSAPAPAGGGAPQQNVTFHVYGTIIGTDQWVENNFLPVLSDVINRDGIVIRRNSAQAREILAGAT